MANAEPKNVNLRLERFEYRAVFSKTGRAKYISHLDLMRAFQRVFKRAHLPIWHTQGFNPHVYIMFPLALPLGTDSRVEIMDFALTEDIPYNEVLERMNAHTPVGLEIVSEIEKRTKKKTINLVDIKPHITVLDSKELEDSFEVTLKLPCGSSFNLNVNVVIDTFCERYGIEISEIYTERTKILMANGENFI